MTTNNGKFAPQHKKPGDLILSDEWNAGMQETVRLESAKVNRKGGDSLQGPLTIESALAVDTTTITSIQLEVKGALKLADGVAVNQFSNDESLSNNRDTIVPTQKAVKTYVDRAVQGSENQDFKAKDVRVYGKLTVDGEVISKDIQKMEGNVELGNEDRDIITVFGTISSRHSTNNLVVNNAIKAPAFIGDGAIVKGIIVMWSGQFAQIPTGWALCNGQNGTPDLRDRFIVGAGNSYAVASTGGAATVALTVEQMPAHSHVFSRIFAQIDGGGIFPGGNNDSPTLQDNTNLTGGNQPHENRPPYYALAFIMKL
jgi:Microcystin-dependent protein